MPLLSSPGSSTVAMASGRAGTSWKWYVRVPSPSPPQTKRMVSASLLADAESPVSARRMAKVCDGLACIIQHPDKTKGHVAQVMRGDKGLRAIEDVELATLSYAEVKALASGNPMVIEKAGVDAEVAKLSTLFSVWRNQRWANESEVGRLPMLSAAISLITVDSQK